MNHLTTESGSQVNMQTSEKNISVIMWCDVDNVVATVGNRVRDVIFSAVDVSIIPRLEEMDNENSSLQEKFTN